MSGRGRLAGLLICLTLVAAILTATVAIPVVAQADSTCGTAGSHTICVSAAGGTLAEDTGVTVTNSPNSGVVITTWIPAGGTATQLIESYAPSPATDDYSFV